MQVVHPEEIRRQIGCEICVKNEGNNLGRYIRDRTEPFLAAIRTLETIPTDETVHPKQVKKGGGDQRVNKWLEKRIDRQHIGDMDGNDTSTTWVWVSKSELK